MTTVSEETRRRWADLSRDVDAVARVFRSAKRHGALCAAGERASVPASDWRDMEPGPELDRLVAERVMGWDSLTHTVVSLRGRQEWWGYRPAPRGRPRKWARVPAYSRKIADAMVVADELRARCNERASPVQAVSVGTDAAGNWSALVWLDESDRLAGVGEARSAPLAICRAALDFVERGLAA